MRLNAQHDYVRSLNTRIWLLEEQVKHASERMQEMSSLLATARVDLRHCTERIDKLVSRLDDLEDLVDHIAHAREVRYLRPIKQ